MEPHASAGEWGAHFTAPRTARFRLWAPGEAELTLRLADRQMPMRQAGDGWYEATVEDAMPGTPYSFLLPDGMTVADPASRAQKGDVHGPSVLVDPGSYWWRNDGWRARPWEEAVIYEVHIGTFTNEGTFRAAAERLPYLKEAGITAVEIMPVAQFGGNRGWGYDGVLIYAPHNAYGSPDDLKHLVDAAHGHGLMVLLDVVYNHFGPDGNYLGRYAPDFFHPERHTPWGAAIAYEKPPVRRFFIDNALYWLEEFRFDGLRLDAIDHIRDEASRPEILVELAAEVRSRIIDRHVHLTTEDNRNITRLHERDSNGRVPLYSGEWNDDLHNVAHIIATGEVDGYYADFVEDCWQKLARALAEGFAYQGQTSVHGGGKPRGRPSGHLTPAAFVDFLQNHDQVGNRAFGERLDVLAAPDMLRALRAMLLLSPHIPLLFMGEEYGERRPFFFFTDFHGDLTGAVREGRRKEFAGFSTFANGHARVNEIPDPNALSTFEASKLDWDACAAPEGQGRLDEIRQLLRLRHEHIVPLLAMAGPNCGRVVSYKDGLVAVDWQLGAATLQLRMNLSGQPAMLAPVDGRYIYASSEVDAEAHMAGTAVRNFAVLVALTGGGQGGSHAA